MTARPAPACSFARHDLAVLRADAAGLGPPDLRPGAGRAAEHHSAQGWRDSSIWPTSAPPEQQVAASSRRGSLAAGLTCG